MTNKQIKHGMTPAEIRRAIYGQDANSATGVVQKRIAPRSKPEKSQRPNSTHDLAVLLDLPYKTGHGVSPCSVPEWLEAKHKTEISVIVPVYDSSAADLIQSWDMANDGYAVEVIFIDDNCPNGSSWRVISEWEKRKSEIRKPFVKVFRSSVTQGWNACCNIGAEVAGSDTLLFIHPSSSIAQGSIRPLFRLLRTKEIGIVAGMQFDDTGAVLDAGSQWSWIEDRFVGIGTEYYRGVRLNAPFVIGNIPAEMSEVAERDKASSRFMMVRKSEFRKLGGFNANISSEEWSDADLCSFYRENGLNVVIQPNSNIVVQRNMTDRNATKGKTMFHNKWIVPSRLDRIVGPGPARPEIETILVKRRAAHGDVLVAAAIAPALKKKFPHCRIVFSTDVPEVLKDNPWIDRIVEEHSERMFQYLVDLDMSYEYRPDENMLKVFADVAGVPVEDCKLFMATKPFPETLPERYAVIHAGFTLWSGRNWSSLKFDSISNKFKSVGIDVVCVGTESDHKTTSCDLDLRGKTNVWQLADVIKRSCFFVGIDSFPMHLAQTFGVRGVSFFGSVRPETRIIDACMIPIVASGLPCLGCHHRKPTPCTSTSFCEIGVQECINNVSAERMWREIERLL